MGIVFDPVTGDLCISITEELSGMMVKEVIRKLTGMSRHVLREILLQGGVTRNGAPCFITNRVSTGDTIRIAFPDDDQLKVNAEPIPLAILYEDPYFIVVDKQPGIVVHPTKGYPNGTLANGLAYHFQSQGLQCKVRPVHRLDRDTSGVIVFAKSHFVHQILSKEIKQHKIDRLYVAFVVGNLQAETGTIDCPISHDPEHSTRRIIDREHGKRAVTHFRVLHRFGHLASVVELKLETGRTHQIRVHMASIGHPLLGDTLYGEHVEEFVHFPIPVHRHALHARTLSFQHPVTKEWLTFQSPLPHDMQDLLERLKMLADVP
jgi:23S rRNA pseudouridine1911/1915/1917 synthase